MRAALCAERALKFSVIWRPYAAQNAEKQGLGPAFLRQHALTDLIKTVIIDRRRRIKRN